MSRRYAVFPRVKFAFEINPTRRKRKLGRKPLFALTFEPLMIETARSRAG